MQWPPLAQGVVGEAGRVLGILAAVSGVAQRTGAGGGARHQYWGRHRGGAVPTVAAGVWVTRVFVGGQ